MNDNDEILQKVLNRAEEIKLEKRKKKRTIYCISTVVTSLIFIIVLSLIMPSVMDYIDVSSVSNHMQVGTFFASSIYIGYVMTGIVAFVLGIVVALICYKFKNEKE